MKTKVILLSAGLALAGACASEIEIASSDVPEAVLSAFGNKYPQAEEIEWEIEKEDGKLYYEAEFTQAEKQKEAYFRPDGTFSKEE
jgi:hypothetical protein